MVNVNNVIKSFRKSPGYTTMRGLARFPFVRSAVSATHRALRTRAYREFLASSEDAMGETLFPQIDRYDFLQRLQRDGLAFGLELPDQTLSEIVHFAQEHPVYADRRHNRGFSFNEREAAEAKLGKPILVAQYFNTTKECGAINTLRRDPLLNWIAAKYLGSMPTFVGANLWWTFPVDASEADRAAHAHLFHRDVDDFRFFKYFFYITDVKADEGAHVCIPGTVRNPPQIRRGDNWNIRRYSDQEIEGYYGKDKILEITGKAGTGFAEDTLCIHKGSTPKTEPRLLLQLQFALFDYGVMNDDAAETALKQLV